MRTITAPQTKRCRNGVMAVTHRALQICIVR